MIFSLACLAVPNARLVRAIVIVAWVTSASAIAAPSAPPPYRQTTPATNAATASFVAGQRAIEQNEWKQAAGYFTDATREDPKSADAWNMLGYASRNMGDFATAFAAYEKAIELDPRHAAAHSYLGVAYVQTNNLPKANEQLMKVYSICGRGCDEYKLLNSAIAEQRKK
jgi:Flp pilus assembly protein TadD